MALVEFGGGITAIVGSIGGTTYSRSPAGAIARARRKGVNPSSDRQNATRASLSLFAQHWNFTISEQHRQDYRDYAAASPTVNKLGQAINISGFAAFIRLNTSRLQMGLGIPSVAPSELGAAGATPLVVTASAGSQEITIAEPVAGFGGDVDDTYLSLFFALPQQGGRVGNPRGFQWRTKLTGSSGAPVSFPFALAYIRTFVEGQRLSVRAVTLDQFDRLSAPTFTSCIAGA